MNPHLAFSEKFKKDLKDKFRPQFWSYVQEDKEVITLKNLSSPPVSKENLTVLSPNSTSYPDNSIGFGKIPAQPHTTLCIQFLDRENNNKNNTLPLEKQICFTIVWGCAEIFTKDF